MSPECLRVISEGVFALRAHTAVHQLVFDGLMQISELLCVGCWLWLSKKG